MSNLLARWSSTSFGSCCSLRGETVDPVRCPTSPYVGLEHLDSGSPLLSRWGLASEVSSTKAVFRKRDVLFGKLRPNLKKSVLADFDGVCSTDILVLKPSAGTDAAFLSFLTHSVPFTEHAIKSIGGVNLPRTSWTALREFEVSLPPLPEQRAIAATLRAVQEARDTRRRERSAEQERKAALMEDLFMGGVHCEARKETEIGPLPQSWKVVTLGAVALQAQYGLSIRGEQQGSYPILRMNCLKEGAVSFEGLQYVNLPEAQYQAFRLRRGDLLFNRTNSADLVGKTGLFDSERASVFASYLVRVALDTKRAWPAFVNYFLNFAPTLVRLRSMAARGVSQANINASKLKTLTIPLPPLDEQKDIAAVLTSCDSKIAALEAEAALHDELFHALLDELLSGRISTRLLIEDEKE